MLTNRNRWMGALFGATLAGACAVAPSEATTPQQPPVEPPPAALEAGWQALDRRQFQASIEAFESLSANPQVAAGWRRQALIGQALAYLSTDASVRDLDAARSVLDQASGLGSAADPGEGLMMLAAGALWTAESENAELRRAAENGGGENRALREEIDRLRAEQARLNEAIRELTEISLSD